ncbi:MAG: hypothetical protein GY701_01595 [Sulfitobacter sp.]|nr:hypothetical protein [Sulfitobacter sp.]
MSVVAHSSGRKVRNGNRYSILDISDRTVTVRRLTGDEGGEDEEGELVLKYAEFFHRMRLGYAVTYASAQGLTIEGLLALHDTGHRYFTQKHLYVGTSRARACDLLIVG